MNARLVNIGYLCFLATAILYGTFGLFIRGLQAHFSDFGQVAVRSLGAFLVAMVWAITSTTSQDRHFYN